MTLHRQSRFHQTNCQLFAILIHPFVPRSFQIMFVCPLFKCGDRSVLKPVHSIGYKILSFCIYNITEERELPPVESSTIIPLHFSLLRLFPSYISQIHINFGSLILIDVFIGKYCIKIRLSSKNLA